MERLQREWATQVAHTDDVEPWQLRRIGGLDVHWIDELRGVACLAVLEWPSLAVLATHCHAFRTELPYEPGFLGFREVPAYLTVWAAAQAAGHEPDLVLVDGFGMCHPRGCGSACHFGLAANCRAIGVGKSLNDVPVLRDKEVKERMAAASATEMQLPDAAGHIVAVAVLKDTNHRQPVYISVGHRISLATATGIVRRCCLLKVPQPVRVADNASRQEAERLAKAQAPGCTAAAAQPGRDNMETQSNSGRAAWMAGRDSMLRYAQLQLQGQPNGSH